DWILEGELQPVGEARQELARFWFKDNYIHFAWGKNATSSANQLRNCLLAIRVDDADTNEPKYVRLRQPLRGPALTFDKVISHNDLNNCDHLGILLPRS